MIELIFHSKERKRKLLLNATINLSMLFNSTLVNGIGKLCLKEKGKGMVISSYVWLLLSCILSFIFKSR